MHDCRKDTIGLAEGQTHPAPAAEREDELVEQVREENTRDGHAEFGRIGEIDLGLAARRVDLLEEDLAIRAVK